MHEYYSSFVKKTSEGVGGEGGEYARLRGTVDRTEKKKHTTLKTEVGREVGSPASAKSAPPSLSTPLDKHRFAYDRHFAGSII